MIKNMYINRIIENVLLDKILNDNKIVLLFGARQVGKTTLVKKLLSDINLNCLLISADEKKYAEVFSNRDFSAMEALVYGYDLLFIDEAQRIQDIGVNLKILHENMPMLKMVATGSSSFELANRTKEPLTGRAWNYYLYPISWNELGKRMNRFELDAQLESRLVFGSYPEVFQFKANRDKEKYLSELTSSYLYKDVLELTTIKHSNKIHNLLKLLSFQVGSLVSINELSRQLEMSKDAVLNYIDLLEKSFVIFRLTGFNRNLRKEISKMDKIYFWDMGVRNAVISNFNMLINRNDAGQLWENFLILERLKSLVYADVTFNNYFWRTYTGGELDLVEERNGSLFGYEFKWGKKMAKAPATWLETYADSKFQCVNRENYIDFFEQKV